LNGDTMLEKSWVLKSCASGGAEAIMSGTATASGGASDLIWAFGAASGWSARSAGVSEPGVIERSAFGCGCDAAAGGAAIG